MDGKVKYCVGFLFDPDMDRVVLIRKNRPPWQQNKLNGVGGALLPLESPVDAMQREFAEETNLVVADWRLLCCLDCPEARIWFFWATSALYYGVRSQTDEEVIIVPIADLMARTDVVANMPWMVMMARSFSLGETARHFEITEVHA